MVTLVCAISPDDLISQSFSPLAPRSAAHGQRLKPRAHPQLLLKFVNIWHEPAGTRTVPPEPAPTIGTGTGPAPTIGTGCCFSRNQGCAARPVNVTRTRLSESRKQPAKIPERQPREQAATGHNAGSIILAGSGIARSMDSAAREQLAARRTRCASAAVRERGGSRAPHSLEPEATQLR